MELVFFSRSERNLFKAILKREEGDFLKKITVIIIIALIVGCVGQKSQQLNWETDAQVAITEAKAEKKSLLILFYNTKTKAIIGGEAANPSEWMDKNVFSDPKVVELLSNKFIIVRLDAETEANAALVRSYGGSVFPFFIVFSADGDACKTFSGTSKVEAFLKKLEGCYT